MIYPVEEREKTRFAIRRLQAYAQEAQIAAQTGKPLPDEVAKAILTFTQTQDKSNQIDALNHLSEDLRARHIAQLKPLAQDDFNAFCEYINPEEPPESKWHIWLTRKLQEIEENPALSRFILNCPPGHAKPLHVDTPVFMSDGTWKRLGDVRVGDYVMTEHSRPRKVSAVHEQGTLPLLKITTVKGRTILSAFDHSFRTFDSDGNEIWKEAQALRPGSKLKVVYNYGDPSKFKPNKDHDLADIILAGLFHACGSHIEAAKQDHYRLWMMGASRLEPVSALLDSVGIKYRPTDQLARGRVFLRLYNRSVRHMMPYLTKASLRTVPNWVHQLSDRNLIKYLLAFMTANGGLYVRKYPTYKMRVNSTEHAIELQRLFRRVGVDAGMTPAAPTRSSTDRWDVNLHGSNLRRMTEYGFRYKKLYPDLFEGLQDDMPIDRDEVKSIEIYGDGECRCLTVEEDHTFVANGIVVHNSTYASRLFVAWRMGRNPTHKIIGGGHSQTFVENEFSAKIRAIVGSAEFSSLFPDVVISSDTRSKSQWVLAGKGGQYAARGVGQGVHGFRAHFVCVDDPYSKVEAAESPVERAKIETWFTNDLGSRMLPTGKMFLIMTRFHENDLTGYLIEQNKLLPSYARWYLVEAPALCYDPETDILGRKLGEVLWDYYDLQYFMTKKSEWSFQRFSLVYQQRTDAISSDKTSGGFQYYHYLPHQSPEAIAKAKLDPNTKYDEFGKPILSKRDYFRRIVVSVDTATKPGQRNDYSVIQTWGETRDRKHYLLRQQRIKVDFNALVLAIERQARMDDADIILIEDKGNGTSYIQHRGATDNQRRLAPCPIVAFDPGSQSKEFRYDEVSPLIREGSVFLPARANWLDNYVKEFGQFPDGAHDDQVDATTQYLKHVKATGHRRYGTRDVTSFG